MSIHAACAQGNLSTLQDLVAQGQHINARDANGLTPLHWACITGKLPVVKWLVARKVFKNNRDAKGMTPLLYAAREGHLDIVQYLLAEKAFTFVVDNDGNTALHAAARNQHRDVVEALLSCGADGSILNNDKKIYSDYLEQPSSTLDMLKNGTIDSTNGSSNASNDSFEIRVIYESHTATLALAASDTWNALSERLSETLSIQPDHTLSHFIIVDGEGDAESNELRSMTKLIKAYHKIYKASDMYFQVFIAPKPSTPPALLQQPDTKALATQSTTDDAKHSLTDDLKQITVSPEQEFIASCLHDDFVAAENLLQQVNINVKDASGSSALHHSTRSGNLVATQWLLERGAMKNMRNNQGLTPLLLAAANGHLPVVQSLHNAGALMFVENEEGKNAFDLAREGGHIGLAQWLRNEVGIGIEHDDIDVDRSTSDKHVTIVASSPSHSSVGSRSRSRSRSYSNDATIDMSILHTNSDTLALLSTCESGRFDVAITLLSKADVNVQHANGMAPLHFAAQAGHNALLKRLITKGADLSLVDAKNNTALHYACLGGHIDAIELLLEFNSPLEKDFNGLSPFHIACKNNDDEAIKILAQYVHDINDADNFGNTGLHYICEHKNFSLVIWLAENYSPNLHAPNLDDVTPLDLVRNCGYVDITTALTDIASAMQIKHKIQKNTQMLIKACVEERWDKARECLADDLVNVNCVVTEGMTPLHCSARSGDLACVKKLVSMTNMYDAQDTAGCTPLHYACELGFTDITQTLLEAGADVNIVNKKGCTELHIAATHNHFEIAKLLIRYQANVLAPDSHGNSLIHMLCRDGRMDWIEWLESSCDLDINDVSEVNESNQTPLDIALHNNQTEILQYAKELKTLKNKQLTDSMIECLRQDDAAKAALLVKRGADANVLLKNGMNPIHIACVRGHVEYVRVLMEHGASVSVHDSIGYTALHHACWNGHLELVRWLKKGCTDLDVRASDGKTPLHCALICGSTDLVRWLLDRGADIYSKSYDDSSSLHYACESGSRILVQWLLSEYRFNVASPNSNGERPINFAVKSGNVDLVMWLCHLAGYDAADKEQYKTQVFAIKHVKEREALEADFRRAVEDGDLALTKQTLQRGVNVDACDAKGNSALHAAVWKNRSEIIGLLIQEAADIDIRNMKGETPLHVSCMKGNQDITEILVTAGACLDAMDNEGNRVLHFACQSGDLGFVQWMVSSYADLDETRPNSSGISAFVTAASMGHNEIVLWLASHPRFKRLQGQLLYASASGNTERVRELLGMRVDPNVIIDAQSPLHQASIGGQESIVKLLLSSGADVLMRNGDDMTSLHAAAYHGHIEVMKLLVEKLTDVDIVNDAGRTAFHYACEGGHALAAAYLVKQGADVHRIDSQGNNGLHWACEGGDYPLVCWLCDGFAIDMELKNSHGKQAIDIAKSKQNYSIANYLKVKITNLVNKRLAEESRRAFLEEEAALERKRREELEARAAIEERARIQAQNKLMHEQLQQEVEAKEKAKAEIYEVEKNRFLTACNLGNEDIVHEMLMCGMTQTLADSVGNTPLHLAVSAGNPAVVQLLLCSNYPINVANNHLNTPLHIACRKKHDVCASLLIYNGADALQLDESGTTSLHLIVLFKLWKALEAFRAKNPGYIFDEILFENGNSILHVAAANDDTESVRQFINFGVDKMAKNELGQTVLHRCAVENFINVCSLLLDCGAACDCVDHAGSTPLMLASRQGHSEMVRLLLTSGASVHNADRIGWTALHYACESGHVSIVNLLIEYGSDIYAASIEDETPLSLAEKHVSLKRHLRRVSDTITEFLEVCESGDLSWLEKMIASGVNVNACDKQRSSALHIACKKGNSKVIELLLRHECFMNPRDKLGLTPLHYLCLGGYTDLAKRLVEKGAQFVLDATGNSCMHLAARANHVDVMKWLISVADDGIHAVTIDGWTPLHDASASGSVDAIRFLLSVGSDTSTATKASSLPIHLCCMYGHTAAAKVILDHDYSSVNVRDGAGLTPFLLACTHGHVATAQWLVDEGADYTLSGSVQDKSDTALHMACMRGDVAMCQWLLQIGFSVSKKNDNNMTPPALAKLAGYHELGELLLSANTIPYKDRIRDCVFPRCKDAYEQGRKKLCAHLFDDVASSYMSRRCDVPSTEILQYAAILGRIDVLAHLKKNACNITGKIHQQQSAIFYAVAEGHDDVVHYLLQNGCSVNDENAKGVTLVQWADMHNRADLAAWLRSNGANDYDTPVIDVIIERMSPSLAANDEPPLIAHCRQKDIEGVMHFLNIGQDVNTIALESGIAPLHVACEVQNLEIVELLVNRGASVNLQSKDGITPLHVACVRRNDAIALFLIRNGADLTIMDVNSIAPLQIICARGHVSLLSSIIELPRSVLRSLKFNILTSNDSNLLHLTLESSIDVPSMIAMVKVLLQQGVNPNHYDSLRVTPLHIACTRKLLPVVELMLQYKGDANVVNGDGVTCVMIAVVTNNFDLLHVLHQHGGDLQVPCGNGNTLLHIACEKGYREIAKYLVRNGLNPNLENGDKMTPTKYAHQGDFDDLLEWMLAWTLAKNMGKAIEQVLVEAHGLGGSEGVTSQVQDNSAVLDDIDEEDDMLLNANFSSGADVLSGDEIVE